MARRANAVDSAIRMRQRLIDRSQAIKRYGVSTFSGTQMRRYYDSGLIPDDFFRVFNPVKPEKKRRLNPVYDPDFDMYFDTLMDYPTVIQGKMGGRWEQYNRMIAVQVAACTPFDCWHCYLDEELKRGKLCTFVTAAQLVDSFIQQRERDRQAGLEDNVLRITGGEPFLLPDLILDCLSEIKGRGLDKEVFIWTETNLSPFLKRAGSARSIVEEWLAEEGKSLSELAQYKNFCVHPCLHGISKQNMEWITRAVDPECFEGLLEGLRILIEYGIDIYPTFGANMSPPELLPEIFSKMVSIHRNLPLRFALINYELNYEQVLLRMKTNSQRYSMVYNKDLVIALWDELIRKEYTGVYGPMVGYATIPRHLVSLGGNNNCSYSKDRTIQNTNAES